MICSIDSSIHIHATCKLNQTAMPLNETYGTMGRERGVETELYHTSVANKNAGVVRRRACSSTVFALSNIDFACEIRQT